jgi:serine/threonine protein kinase
VQTLTPNEQAPESTNAGPALSEGTKIGGCYVLRKDLSKVGESPVWLASDEVLGKDVTLHFVPAAVAADARAMTELRQEVKRNRQLIHPNILRVYDFVEDGNFVAISMDAFAGESLQDLLKKKGRMDPDDLKPWVAQLAETLADAHRIQLFHRDLAPANLYLRPNGGLLVANFGVSRVILNSLERAGLAKGNAARLSYLSPQQLDGERPGASDDIYGFGVLMHELLAGAPPFAGEDLVPQIRKTAPAPVSDARAAAGATASVPASWSKLIAGCLQKTPEARPRNLADVLSLLGQDSGPVRPRAEAAVAEKAAPEIAAEHHVAADEPVKTPESSESTGNGSIPGETVSAASEPEPAAEKPAVSQKPLHPEIPPITPGTVARKSPAKGALSANFPDLDRPRSKAPLIWLFLAAAIIGVGIYMRNMPNSNEGDADGSVARIDETPSTPPDNVPPAPKKDDGPDSKSPEVLPDPEPVIPPKTVAAATPVPKPTKPGALIGSEPVTAVQPSVPAVVPETPAGAAAHTGGKTSGETKTPPPVKPTPEKVAVPPTPQPGPRPVAVPVLPEAPQSLAKIVLPPKPTMVELDEAKKQREAAIASLGKTAADAATALQEATHRLETAKLEKDKRQKDLDAKRKTLTPVIQQAEALEAERKKLEEDLAKAQAAASEAAKQAEAAKLKLDDVVAKGGEKLKARQQAEVELNAATAEVASLGKEVDGLSQLIVKGETLREQVRLSQQQAEQDLQKIAAAGEQARRAETEAMRKANQGKITAIEKQIQDVKTQMGKLNAALGPLKELGDAGKEAMKKIEDQLGASTQQLSELQAEVRRLSGDTEGLPIRETGIAKPPVVTPETPPDKGLAAPVETKGATNSLGMKFAAVGDVQFSVYLTTRKDFEAFATAAGLKSEAWKNPGFKQAPDHPVVNVTWREAEAFCKWLTEKERKAGLLKGGEIYRLPTDAEWSKAVGLPAEMGATPEERDMGVQDVYPWGNQWPPPAGSGNYAGEECDTEIPIPGYNDGFRNTSPVGKFRVNAFGLYDMGGNVWQWVSDYWNSENRAKTLRGGSWYNGAIPLSLLSSCRISSSPDTLHDTYGFRIVKGVEPGKARGRR